MTTSTNTKATTSTTNANQAVNAACGQPDNVFLNASFGDAVLSADNSQQLAAKVAQLVGTAHRTGIATLAVMARHLIPANEEVTLNAVAKAFDFKDVDGKTPAKARTPMLGQICVKTAAYIKEFPAYATGEQFGDMVAAHIELGQRDPQAIADQLTTTLEGLNLKWKSAKKKFAPIWSVEEKNTVSADDKEEEGVEGASPEQIAAAIDETKNGLHYEKIVDEILAVALSVKQDANKKDLQEALIQVALLAAEVDTTEKPATMAQLNELIEKHNG